MGRLSMASPFARGAAAALMSMTLAGTVAAQTVISVPRRGTARDSILVRTFGLGKMDTILVLWRSLAHEQYGSPAWFGLSRKLDSLVIGMPRMMLRQSQGEMRTERNVPRGWLGFNAQGPSMTDGEKVTYFAHPQILSVDPESPADRAGIIPGDVLVAFNGLDVVGREFDRSRLIVPDTKVSVTIRRDGEMKDFPLQIVKVPQGVFNRRIAFNVQPMPPGAEGATIIRIDSDEGNGGRARPGGGARGGSERVIATLRGGLGPMVAGVIVPHAVFGADVSTVRADLARALKIERGVLVNDVPETSPAYKSGLRVGDVIVGASGQSVETLGRLQDLIVSHFGERSVVLQVMRGHKRTEIKVIW
jgi:membrane-associated protease RseP (regulator of RpoE activity)